jgi:hypothetical protein
VAALAHTMTFMTVYTTRSNKKAAATAAQPRKNRVYTRMPPKNKDKNSSGLMQPRHKPDNTFGTWEEIDKAPAIAAAATSHSESSSSPASSNDADVRASAPASDTFQALHSMMLNASGASPSNALGASPSSSSSPEKLSFEAAGTFLHGGDDPSAAIAASEVAQQQQEADISAGKGSQSRWAQSNFLNCGTFCAKNGCRKMVLRHKKGIVCTTCMSQEKWRKCLNCEAVAHVDCATNLESWKCPACMSSEDSQKVERQGDGFTLFESREDAYSYLRKHGYRINNTQSSGITFECNACSKTFYVKKCSDGRFSCPMNIDHAPTCSRPSYQPAQGTAGNGVKIELKGVHSVRYSHEFSQHPGLLEFIQTLSCTGDIRADQLQRSVSKVFNVVVETQLLYRTAKNAHEDMFGSTRSDVEELLHMENQVMEEGGFLKLFLGDYVAA